MQTILKLALALLIGTAGGWIFSRLNLPLPWMLGPMLACGLASLARLPVSAHRAIRPPMTVVIGIMLGAKFTPESVSRLGEWIVPLLCLPLFLVLCGAACIAYFRKAGKLDAATAYFSGMPGGVVDMVIAGSARGADERTVALIQAARIFLVVMTLPFIIQVMAGPIIRPVPGAETAFAITPDETAWFLGVAGLGGLAAYFLPIQASYLLAPMAISAAVHLAGWSDFVPPALLVNGAQIVLGTTIGCRFAGVPVKEILRVMLLSIGSTAILLAITIAFGFALPPLSGVDPAQIVLAYSPGGFSEMSLIALTLHMEVAFVVVHHAIRAFSVTLFAGMILDLARRRGWTS